jgi:hypothetical protein
MGATIGAPGGVSLMRVMGARNWYTTWRVVCKAGVACRMIHSKAM